MVIEEIRKFPYELLTLKEAAEFLRVHERTLQRMRDRGEINAIRLGEKTVRIEKDELIKFIQHGRQS